MTDLVERLRAQAWRRSGAPKMDAGHTKMLEWEAANEIERLRERVEMVMSINHQQGDKIERLEAQVIEAEKYNGWHQIALLKIEQLRVALGRLVNDSMYKDHPEASQMAIDALEGKP